MSRDGALPSLPPDATVVKAYRSKKNAVALVERGGERFVVKEFSEEGKDAMGRELRMLALCKERGIRVPEVASHDGTRVWMVPCEGEALIDTISGQSGEREKRLEMGRCARWLRSLHEAMSTEGLIHGDATMGNFIMGAEVAGIDFEESREGTPEEDVGMLIANVLANFGDDPMLSLTLTQGTLEGYGPGILDEARLGAATVAGLEHLARFREDGERLLKVAAIMRG